MLFRFHNGDWFRFMLTRHLHSPRVVFCYSKGKFCGKSLVSSKICIAAGAHIMTGDNCNAGKTPDQDR